MIVNRPIFFDARWFELLFPTDLVTLVSALVHQKLSEEMQREAHNYEAMKDLLED